MGKINNFLIVVAEEIIKLLNDGVKPEYVEMELRELLHPDEFTLYKYETDFVMEMVTDMMNADKEKS